MRKIEYLIVGTGFGGGTVGLRLAEAGKEVVFLERGKIWKGKNLRKLDDPTPAFPEFADADFFWGRQASNLSRQRLGLYELKQFSNLQGIVAAGVGGGSLIWANVVVEAHADSFLRNWPQAMKLESLVPYYLKARPFLKPSSYPGFQRPLGYTTYPKLKRAELLREAAAKLGAPWQQVDLAVNFGEAQRTLKNGFGDAQQRGCDACALCVAGCPQGAKNSVDLSYLAAAKSLGAQVLERQEAFLVQEIPGGYRVFIKSYNLDGTYQRTFLDAKHLILAAGTYGTTQLLLRSKAAGLLPHLSRRLGDRFSINGNVLSGALAEAGMINPAELNTGPSVSSMIDFGQYVVEDIASPLWLSGMLGKGDFAKSAYMLKAMLGFKMSESQLKSLATDLLVYVGVGLDRANGKLRLDRFGRLSLDWKDLQADPAVQAQHRAQSAIAQALGRQYVPDVFSTFGRAFTYHPLGGCSMGDDVDSGVVDSFGAVFNYKNLYVVDGSIVPNSLGRNPAYTICALAERAAENMVA